MKINDRVYISPIKEFGIIKKIRKDDRGEPLIDVIRESDGEVHVCREMELTPASSDLQLRSEVSDMKIGAVTLHNGQLVKFNGIY
jgi:hypothetical protein